MTHVFCYIVAASKNPDAVECPVPYRIDDMEVFFGPCKKSLREWMRNHYLSESTESTESADDVYVVGFNGSNSSRIRKILWIGKLTRVLTFSAAWHLTEHDRRYEQMRAWRASPLHVGPVIERGRLVGYEHRSEMHADNWVMDLMRSGGSPNVTVSGNRLMLRKHASAWQGFPRDVCMFFQNMFFADGCGIAIDDDFVSILQAAQPRHNVDDYAVFGYRADGTADGKTGSYLHLTGERAGELVDWVRRMRPVSSSSFTGALKGRTGSAAPPRTSAQHPMVVPRRC